MADGCVQEKDNIVNRVREQDRVNRRYDRMASLYDLYDAPMEWMGTKRRRRRLLERASGRVLEVGIGTGKNLPHYPADVDIMGIDASSEMLARTKRRARDLGRNIDLDIADVTSLPFADGTFDTTVATCVFCSVADPVAGRGSRGTGTGDQARRPDPPPRARPAPRSPDRLAGGPGHTDHATTVRVPSQPAHRAERRRCRARGRRRPTRGHLARDRGHPTQLTLTQPDEQCHPLLGS